MFSEHSYVQLIIFSLLKNSTLFCFGFFFIYLFDTLYVVFFFVCVKSICSAQQQRVAYSIIIFILIWNCKKGYILSQLLLLLFPWKSMAIVWQNNTKFLCVFCSINRVCQTVFHFDKTSTWLANINMITKIKNNKININGNI